MSSTVHLASQLCPGGDQGHFARGCPGMQLLSMAGARSREHQWLASGGGLSASLDGMQSPLPTPARLVGGAA